MLERGTITHGDLPHWFMPGAAHFVTYRLADTLPGDVLQRLRSERDARLRQPAPEGMSAAEHRSRQHKAYFAAYDEYLDRVSSVHWLETPAVAQIIVGNLYHHHASKYQLLEYVVMPSHVHVLLVPIVADAASVGLIARAPAQSDGYYSGEVEDAKSPLSKIMHSLKSYTANEANRVLGREGRFWQKESYDHWVRNDTELARIAEYICQNPVKAGLVANAWDWPYGSARDRKFPRTLALPEWW